MSFTKEELCLIEKAKRTIITNGDRGSNGEAVHVRASESRFHTGPCHGFLIGTGRRDSIAIVSRCVRHRGYDQVGTAILVEYYDWLFNRSPWANVFYSRSAEKAIREECVVLRADVPANMLQGAAICTRNTWEFIPHIRLWSYLVNKGVDEHEAFLAIYFLSVNLADKTVSISPLNRDHIAISPGEMSVDDMKFFKRNRPVGAQSGTYKTDHLAAGAVHGAFLSRGTPLKDLFQRDFKEYGRAAKSVVNPFAKAKVGRNTESKCMSFQKFSEFMKDKFSTYFK